uniref:16S rRNA (adenine(1518)-N(6)/adenine(1519)-N(6))- dimethyltransferase RsmA n=1 Tax=Ndongobacter massiliensis TaxID=1871025 RepID=UPI000930D44A|nr:16S rRNA (adenine(1518)-N(6)/adenine(1519)-N(6))-dimethyltransferase RsmA [Ndongobacter massiliensis]
MSEKPLYSVARIRQIMEDAGLPFLKKWGQNFLTDGNLIKKIVAGAGITSEDVVLEIGPGIGTLTEALLPLAKRVIAVEIDGRLIPILTKNFQDYANFHLLHADALQLDLVALLQKEAPGERVQVVANLPYYITTPLLERLLNPKLPVNRCTLMVQKEVAERMTAAPSTKEYGSLTLFIACYARAQILFPAPKTVFFPAPKVDSAVVRLDRRESPDGVDVARVSHWIQCAFQNRRKTVLNSLQNGEAIDKTALKEALQKRGIPLQARAEDLRLEDYLALARELF